jgi:hypothetical protein
VRHRRYRGGREEDSLSLFLVIVSHPSSWSVTSDEKEAGTIGPAGGPERIRKLIANHRNLSGRDEVIAQRGSVPQARSHSASRPKCGFVRRSGFLLQNTDTDKSTIPHANPIYANACRAQCPELNTSEFHPAPEAGLSPLF